MPTISNSNLPTPKSWEEFEEITLDALKIKWDNPDLLKNGRTGQAQAGVDIYGNDYFFQLAGVQCKKYEFPLIMGVVKEEIAKAETQPTDAKLQKEIRLLTKDRVGNGKFPIGIFFWNDIVQEIVTNDALLKGTFRNSTLPY